MKKYTLFLTVVIAAGVNADTITIKGLTAYADADHQHAYYVDENAAVELYKWTGEAWEETNIETTTGADKGYYQFLNVDLDQLRPEEPYFMVKVTGDAQTMPYWQGGFYTSDRCAYALAQPLGPGWPNPGVARVDVLFFGPHFIPPPSQQPPYYEFSVGGHFAKEEGGVLVLPTMGTADYRHELTTPDAGNYVRVGGCAAGDWYFANGPLSATIWGQVEGPAYAHFVFYNEDNPPAPMAEGYFCWASPWPWWALGTGGCAGPTANHIQIDFIAVPLP